MPGFVDTSQCPWFDRAAYDYGALGPVANLAARLSTQAAPRQILIGTHLYTALEESIEASPVGQLQLEGFGRPISTYQVHSLRTIVQPRLAVGARGARQRQALRKWSAR